MSLSHALHIDALKLDAARRRLTTLVLVWLGAVAVAVAVGSRLSGDTTVDHRISVWFAENRSVALNKVTTVMSESANTFVVIGVALAVFGLGARRRRAGGVAVIVIAMIGEVTMFLTITFFVDRARPDVAHLDQAPPTSSFPSGHVFAACVLWIAIAVVALRQDWPRVLRRVTRFLAIAMPVVVGLSRVYRGMHHPTDVVASLVLGVMWMCAVVLVVVPGEPTDRPPVTRSEPASLREHGESAAGALGPVDHRA